MLAEETTTTDKYGRISSLVDEEFLFRADLAYFAEEMLGMEISAHHDSWSQLIARHNRLCIEAPRDHGKSFMFSFAYAIWRAYYNWIPTSLLGSDFKSIPRVSVGYIFSNTQDQAIKLLELVKHEIETNPKLFHLIPAAKDTWNKTEILLSNGAIIRARGWGQSVRGAHPTWVVCDDCLNDETIYSEMMRMKQIDYFFSAVTPMVVPGGQLIVVGTPFHQEDLYQKLNENRIYTFSRFAALDTYGNALWPTRYNKEALMKRKDEVGSTRFAREYLCVDKDTPIKTEDGWKKIKDIMPEDRVLSHDGKYHRVLDVFRNRLGDRKVFRVKTSNGLGHIVTEGHELLVTTTDYRRDIESSKTEWRKVEEISQRPGDRTYLKVPLEPEHFMKAVSSVSDDMAFLAGWYLAEGHCGTSQQVTLSLNTRDPIDDIQAAAVKVFGKKFVDYTHAQGCIQWSINSKDAKWFFSQLGRGSSKKKIPELFKHIQDSAKRSLLKAYFMGDGHFDGMTLECTSVSFQLICDVSDMLLSLGIACGIQKAGEARGMKILGRDVLVKDSWRLKICGSNLDKFYGLPSTRRSSSSFVKDGFLYSRIRKIEQIDYDESHVYDLNVEDAHSYVGLHGTFHNCTPISEDSSLFPERILQPCYDHSFEMPNHLSAMDRQELRVFTGVDLAMSSTVGADYTVITTIGVDAQSNRWILDIRRKKGLSMMDQLREIQDVHRIYKPVKILIEDNAFQRVFRDELVRNTDLPVEGFTTTAHNKNSAERGVPSLQILFENRKFVIPRKTARDREITDILINELKCFTFVNGKMQGLGAHDDCVMSLWITNEAVNSYAFSFTFG